MRAASPALQEWWPDGQSPHSWGGVVWSIDRVQKLNLVGSKLEVLPPQIGQLQALTRLNLTRCLLVKLPPEVGQLRALTWLNLNDCPLTELPPQIGQLQALTKLNLTGCPLVTLPPQIGQLRALTTLALRSCPLKVLPPEFGQLLALDYLDLHGCPLKELPPEIGQLQALALLNLGGCPLVALPPEIGQLLALSKLYLHDCEQLTLAPGAEVEQLAQTIVAAYTRLLIVEPRKDTPDQLHAFLLNNPLWVPAFFKTILKDAALADWLEEAVIATSSLAGLTDGDGRRAIDVAHSTCKQAMQAALFLLGRYEVDVGELLHRSATAAVAAATDHGDPKAKAAPRVRVALKAMREVAQVCAELEGRVGLGDSKYVVAVKAVYADAAAVGDAAWQQLKEAADELNIKVTITPGLSGLIQKRLFPNKQETDQASGSEYKLLIVLELADRSLLQTINHDQIAGKDWPAIRHIASNLGWALDHVHTQDGIHADFKPLNAVGDKDTWKIIDFDVFCKVGQPFGNKVPSSGFCPPEMARVLLQAMDDQGKVDGEKLIAYKASEAYDLWSFGVVLYQLCFSTPLWKTDTDDNITLSDLHKLAAASDVRPLRKALDKALYNGGKPSAPVDLAVATALLRKLLEPDAQKRLQHFERANSYMQGMLDEPFFQGQRLDAASQEEILKEVREFRVEQDKQTALLIVIKDLSYDNKIELLHTRKALMKGIFEATEVKTPTTFIILDKELPPELELTDNFDAAMDLFDQGMTWLTRLETVGKGILKGNPDKVLGGIKDVLNKHMVDQTMYLYLVDELTGKAVRGDGYPIVITTPSDVVHKLLPVMQIGIRAMSLYNGVGGIARMFGAPVPSLSEALFKNAQLSVDMLKQAHL